MNIGLLTYDGFPNLIENDQKLIPLFAEKGIQASAVVWNNPIVNWSEYDALIFRNTWDYFIHEADFRNWLSQMKERNILTFNSLQVVLENMHKFYLQDLEGKGIEIIRTLFLNKVELLRMSGALPWPKFIVKPAVSGGAHMTHLYNTSQIKNIATDLKDAPDNSQWLVQPFLREITASGEISLIFIQKKYAFSVRKLPKKGDFRIQTQFGGHHEVCEPSAKIIENAERILALYPNLLYARVDGVIRKGIFMLMEVELIEPDLYFDLFPQARQMFVDSFVLSVAV